MLPDLDLVRELKIRRGMVADIACHTAVFFLATNKSSNAYDMRLRTSPGWAKVLLLQLGTT